MWHGIGSPRMYVRQRGALPRLSARRGAAPSSTAEALLENAPPKLLSSRPATAKRTDHGYYSRLKQLFDDKAVSRAAVHDVHFHARRRQCRLGSEG